MWFLTLRSVHAFPSDDVDVLWQLWLRSSYFVRSGASTVKLRHFYEIKYGNRQPSWIWENMICDIARLLRFKFWLGPSNLMTRFSRCRTTSVLLYQIRRLACRHLGIQKMCFLTLQAVQLIILIVCVNFGEDRFIRCWIRPTSLLGN